MIDIFHKSKYHTVKSHSLYKNILSEYQMYLMILPALIYIIIFNYIPMYGIQIAFRNFRPNLGLTGGEWVGLKYFRELLKNPRLIVLIKNTFTINLYDLAVSFPVTLIFALMINEINNRFIKKTVQMAAYAPHFVSIVVLCSMVSLFLNKDYGVINHIIEFFGGKPKSYMTMPQAFKSIYVFSGVWQNTGWGTIIYMAALSGIDPCLHESASLDGASKLQRIWHINIPGISSTIIILLILRMGTMLSVGFEKILLLQNDLTKETSDVIATYVYQVGLLGGQYSYSTAVGLFNTLVNVAFLVASNQIARKVSGTSLW